MGVGVGTRAGVGAVLAEISGVELDLEEVIPGLAGSDG